MTVRPPTDAFLPMRALALRCAVRSDIGHRENNEDAVFATSRLAVVADGVGGSAAGEVASRLVVDRFRQLDKTRLTGSLHDALAETVLDGNARIAFVTSCRPRHAGMASTVTAVAAGSDGSLHVVNVGDSRTYLYRTGTLSQLTRDDSLVRELLDGGLITPEEARTHPGRSVVLAALDGTQLAAPVPTVVPAQPGDRVLLCSDGLSDAIHDHEIAALLATADREQCAQSLVHAALDAGGRDNITLVVADIELRLDAAAGWP